MGEAKEWIEELYLKIGGNLFLYFQNQNHTSDTAQDLLQETFFRSLKNMTALTGADCPEAYVFGIARNVSLEVHRKRKQILPIDDGLIPVEDANGAGIMEIQNLLAQLPGIYRETLELRIGRDLSYVEIAQALDIPIGTVRSRLFYALKFLRERIGPELDT